MDAGAHHRPSLGGVAKRLRYQRAHRREQNGGVHFLRWRCARVARPGGPQLAGETLCLCITRPGESENLAPLPAGHLGDDVCRRAETVDADPFCIAGRGQRAIADQPRAKQRRRFGIRVCIRQGKAIAPVGQREFGIAAIQGIAGELRLVAEVFATARSPISEWVCMSSKKCF